MCCAFSSTSNTPAGTHLALLLVSLGELLETGVCGSPVWLLTGHVTLMVGKVS